MLVRSKEDPLRIDDHEDIFNKSDANENNAAVVEFTDDEDENMEYTDTNDNENKKPIMKLWKRY